LVPLSGLTSAVQAAQSTQEPSPSNSYEEIGSPTLPKVSPQAPTIDQLLSEIEEECHGPDYKYSPPADASPRGPSEEVWVSPYKFSPPEGRRGFSQDAWVYPYGLMTPNIGTRQLRRNSLQDFPYHQKSASLDGYEMQRDGGGGFSISSNVSCLPPHEMRAVQNAVDRTFEDYETIPYHPSSDDDTYVYMAQCREVQSSSPQPSHSSQESSTSNGDCKSRIPKRGNLRNMENKLDYQLKYYLHCFLDS
jgi:hypothetical protein